MQAVKLMSEIKLIVSPLYRFDNPSNLIVSYEIRKISNCSRTLCVY